MMLLGPVINLSSTNLSLSIRRLSAYFVYASDLPSKSKKKIIYHKENSSSLSFHLFLTNDAEVGFSNLKVSCNMIFREGFR